MGTTQPLVLTIEARPRTRGIVLACFALLARLDRCAAVVVNAASAHGAEALTYLAFVAGWLCLTAGIARMTSVVAWWISVGLLLLSLGGLKPFAIMCWHGLYALSHEESE